jgi:D-aminopeptidase
VRRSISLSPSNARGRIKEAARKVILRVDEFQPLKLKKPFALKVEYINLEFAEKK